MARSSSYEIRDPSRPRCRIPKDADHEFLTNPLPRRSLVLQGWIRHFAIRGIPICVAPSRGGIQLYLHKRLTDRSGLRAHVWCCKDTQKTLAVPVNRARARSALREGIFGEDREILRAE